MKILNENLINFINISKLKNSLININDFKIIKIIGEGATCIVYEAIYIRTNEKFALKIIPKFLENKILF